MTRREFPQKIKIAVIKRQTWGGQTWCEQCKLPARKWQIDHMTADAIGGKPVIENAQLLCEVCYSIKNPQDTTRAAKTKRQEAAHLGAKAAPKVEIKSRGFAHKEKRAALHVGLEPLPRRALFK